MGLGWAHQGVNSQQAQGPSSNCFLLLVCFLVTRKVLCVRGQSSFFNAALLKDGCE